MNKVRDLFGHKLKVISLGIQIFYEELKKQGVESIHIDWRPPAMGDENLQKILDQIRKG